MGSRETARAAFRPPTIKFEVSDGGGVYSASSPQAIPSIEGANATASAHNGTHGPVKRSTGPSPLYKHPDVPVAGLTPAEYAAALRYGGQQIAASVDPNAERTRAKKPVKDRQRVRTGCLTCRKRRVKCDEGLPVCSKCSRGKRQCIYDPDSKPESPSPTPTFRAISGYSSPSTLTHPVGLHLQNTTLDIQGSGRGKKKRKLNSGPSHPGWKSEEDDCIDPALAAKKPRRMASAAVAQTPQPRNMSHDSRPSHDHAASSTDKERFSISDLYMMGGRDPPTPKITEPTTPQTLEEIKSLYTEEYATGIDEFLETTWYTKYGLQRLMSDGRVMDMFAGMVELFRTTTSANFEVMHQLPSTEARTVWELMSLARTAATDTGIAPAEREELQVVVARLAIFEYLITAQQMEVNPLQSTRDPAATSTQQARQLRFWNLLGQFTILPLDKGPSSSEDDHNIALTSLRGLLDGQENRDVLYSIAVTRHFGAKTTDFPDRVGPQQPIFGLNTTDKNRLLVAKKFVEEEAAGQGTSQVVQRICAMAARSWVHL